MLHHIAELVRLGDGSSFVLGAQEQSEGGAQASRASLVDFATEKGLPVWRYQLGPNHVLEKSVVMPYRQNTVVVRYRVLEGALAQSWSCGRGSTSDPTKRWPCRSVITHLR